MYTINCFLKNVIYFQEKISTILTYEFCTILNSICIRKYLNENFYIIYKTIKFQHKYYLTIEIIQ